MIAGMLPTLDEIADKDPNEKIFVPCGRCGGQGVISWSNVKYYVRVRDEFDGKTRSTEDNWCFDCNGIQGFWLSVRKVRSRIKGRERYAAKKEEKRLEKLAEMERQEQQKRDENASWRVENAETLAFLENAGGTFFQSLRDSMEKYGKLTDNQLATVARIKSERESEPEAENVPDTDTRIWITGTVKSTKRVESDYGDVLKMLVLDDRGFKVWGSVPKGTTPYNYYNIDGEHMHAHGIGCGGVESNHDLDEPLRVQFVAKVIRSDDDSTFGFFSRPTKAELLNRTEIHN